MSDLVLNNPHLCFKGGDFDVDDRLREGKPKTFEDAELEALLDEDPCQTEQELSSPSHIQAIACVGNDSTANNLNLCTSQSTAQQMRDPMMLVSSSGRMVTYGLCSIENYTLKKRTVYIDGDWCGNGNVGGGGGPCTTYYRSNDVHAGRLDAKGKEDESARYWFYYFVYQSKRDRRKAEYRNEGSVYGGDEKKSNACEYTGLPISL
ncbi:hypothetical protein Trydic_g21164, partial [Trypoxylus dichotomus]